MQEVKSGIYKHFKGKFCEVICTAKHSDRDELLVVYKGLNDGGHFARPIESFLETVIDSNGNPVKRFEIATEEEVTFLKSENLI